MTTPDISPPISVWRHQPYRVFFPLGFLLAWAGVLHWLLHGLGVLPDYRPVFHAITQIQGFMMCFAAGFLLTAIPRRTGTAPPASWQLLLVALGAIGTVVSAWFQQWAASQFAWMLLVIVLAGFAIRRFLSSDASRRPPNSFVWVPLSFLIGITGSVLIGAYGILGDEYYQLHQFGTLLLLQGMFLGLIIGMGGMLLPLITRRSSSTDADSTSGDRLIRLAHGLSAVALVATFWIENYLSLRWGLGLRALLVLVLLLVVGEIWKLPTAPGTHRRLVWLSTWMIPAGYLLAAAFPAEKKAGLHLVFIGGFAMMALGVGLHVTLAHGGNKTAVFGRSPQALYFGLLLGAAMVCRALVDFDPQRFFLWIIASATSFLLATLLWAWLAIPWLVPREPAD
jgi:uncharacterized protein involved in response to NO